MSESTRAQPAVHMKDSCATNLPYPACRARIFQFRPVGKAARMWRRSSARPFPPVRCGWWWSRISLRQPLEDAMSSLTSLAPR